MDNAFGFSDGEVSLKRRRDVPFWEIMSIDSGYGEGSRTSINDRVFGNASDMGLGIREHLDSLSEEEGILYMVFSYEGVGKFLSRGRNLNGALPAMFNEEYRRAVLSDLSCIGGKDVAFVYVNAVDECPVCDYVSMFSSNIKSGILLYDVSGVFDDSSLVPCGGLSIEKIPTYRTNGEKSPAIFRFSFMVDDLEGMPDDMRVILQAPSIISHDWTKTYVTEQMERVAELILGKFGLDFVDDCIDYISCGYCKLPDAKEYLDAGTLSVLPSLCMEDGSEEKRMARDAEEMDTERYFIRLLPSKSQDAFISAVKDYVHKAVQVFSIWGKVIEDIKIQTGGKNEEECVQAYMSENGLSYEEVPNALGVDVMIEAVRDGVLLEDVIA